VISLAIAGAVLADAGPAGWAAHLTEIKEDRAEAVNHG
jgi:hypothetical protein